VGVWYGNDDGLLEYLNRVLNYCILIVCVIVYLYILRVASKKKKGLSVKER